MGFLMIWSADLDCAMVVQLLLVKLVEVVVWSHSLALIACSVVGGERRLLGRVWGDP